MTVHLVNPSTVSFRNRRYHASLAICTGRRDTSQPSEIPFWWMKRLPKSIRRAFKKATWLGLAFIQPMLCADMRLEKLRVVVVLM